MNDRLGSALAHPSQLLDSVCEALPAAVLAYDRYDQILFASKQILNFFSLPTDLMMPGTRLRDFLGAIYDTRPGSLKGLAKGGGAREEWVAERLAMHWRERHEVIEAYGYGRYVRLVKRRFANGTGLCVMTDVSEHHKREEQWRADISRVQLIEEILDNIPFPVFLKDANYTYVAANRAFCNVRGLDADEILGRTIFDFAPPAVADVFDATDRQVLETGQMVTVPERLVRSDGQEISVITRKVRIGKTGRHYLLTTMEDVTELLEARKEEGLRASAFNRSLFPNLEEGEAMAPAKPISGHHPAEVEPIIPERFAGCRALLVCPDVTVEVQASRILKRLGIDFHCVKCPIEQEAFLYAAMECGVDIDVVVIDAQMEARSIELAAHHGINVLVMDGPSMASELSYQLVRHFNGSWGRPAFDGNPLQHIEIETIIVEPQFTLSMIDVLVVEDNVVNQIVFSQILEGLGYGYRIAENGAEALKLSRELVPRVILLDLTLPDRSGFDMIGLLRASDPALEHVPIIGIVVAGQKPDAGDCAAAGMNGTILKPISPEALESVLRLHLHTNDRMGAA